MNSPLSKERISIFNLIILCVILFSYILFPNTVFAISNENYILENKIEEKKENIFSSIIDEYILILQKNGYEIVSFNLDIENLVKDNNGIYIKNPEEYIKKQILNNLEVIISCYELNIKDNYYYFINEKECNDYIEILNSIEQQEYNVTQSQKTYSSDLITSKEILQQRQNEIQEEKNRKDEEERKSAEIEDITSRSSRARNHEASAAAFPLPYYNYLSSPYGWRSRGYHTGNDFAVASGTQIYAWKTGTVTYAGWKGNYGNFIIIDHHNGQVSRYAHCSKIAVSVGQYVSVGETIGYVGSTGNSTGPHLHFEIMINRQFVNSMDYLK